MKKEEILEMSRKENKGKNDERVLAAFGMSAKIGMLVAGILCFILILLSEFLFHSLEIGLSAWLIYSAMCGSHSISLYTKIKGRKWLVGGIIALIAAVAFAVTLCVVTLG